MLHAVNQRKAKLSAFRGPGSRVPLEDMVTSTVWGSLSFLHTQERSKVLSMLLTGLGLPTLADNSQHLHFWPKRDLSSEGFRTRYVEPDLVVTDSAGGMVIVEVKWGAPLGPLELSSQWLSVDSKQRAKARHLLLVTEPAKYDEGVAYCRSALISAGISEWPIVVRSWRTLAELCRRLSLDDYFDSGARAWARQVHAFLKREDPDGMLGWDDLALRRLDPFDWSVRSPAWKYEIPIQVQWSVQ